MFKVVLTVLVPLLLPTLVYLTYMALAGRRRAAAGAAPEATRSVPWFWLVASGVALTAALLVTLALVGGHGTDTVYIPAHVGPDGQQVPARTVPRDQLPPR